MNFFCECFVNKVIVEIDKQEAFGQILSNQSREFLTKIIAVSLKLHWKGLSHVSGKGENFFGILALKKHLNSCFWYIKCYQELSQTEAVTGGVL